MTQRKFIPARELIDEWFENPAFVKEYEAQEEEFALAAAMIEARALHDLTQEEVAERMGTSQSAIGRIESGRGNPSLKTLRRYAEATGTTLRIKFEPIDKKP